MSPAGWSRDLGLERKAARITASESAIRSPANCLRLLSLSRNATLGERRRECLSACSERPFTSWHATCKGSETTCLMCQETGRGNDSKEAWF
ncbi:hypothetical protein D3C76_555050 [compost metagenome]